MVGTSGSIDERFAVVTASTLTLPLFMKGCADNTGTNAMSTSPDSTAVVAGPPPLYGTCVTATPAYCFSISIDRWLVVPMPLDDALNCPARFLASATSSGTLLTGTLGCTTSTSGTEDTHETGSKSLTGSNASFLYRLTLTASEALEKSTV